MIIIQLLQIYIIRMTALPMNYYYVKIVEINVVEIDAGKEEIMNKTISSIDLVFSKNKHLFNFKSKSKFIFIQSECSLCQLYKYSPITYEIPKIENKIISILLSNQLKDYNANYSFILIEDVDKNDELLNKLDNECYFFSLINKKIDNINYFIKKTHIYKSDY